MMIKEKIEILKLIDKAKNVNTLEDYESLKAKGFDKGLLNAMIKENLIEYGGSDFYLKEKSETVLRDSLIIEHLDKLTLKKIKILFDTNIYNEIVDGAINLQELKKSLDSFEYYITHIQIDELNKCSDEDKRARLTLTLFNATFRATVIETESSIVGTSRLGFARLGDDKLIEKLRIGNHNHTEDALIGETAIKNDILLVTNDETLRKRVHSNGGRAVSLGEFKEMLK